MALCAVGRVCVRRVLCLCVESQDPYRFPWPSRCGCSGLVPGSCSSFAPGFPKTPPPSHSDRLVKTLILLLFYCNFYAVTRAGGGSGARRARSIFCWMVPPKKTMATEPSRK